MFQQTANCRSCIAGSRRGHGTLHWLVSREFTVLRHNARNKRCNSSAGKLDDSHIRCDLHKQPFQVTTADGYSETAVSTKTHVKNPWKGNLVDRAMTLSTVHFHRHKQKLQYRPNDRHLSTAL